MKPHVLVLLLLFACGSPERRPESPIDTEYARLEAGARSAFGRGDLGYAAELYARLLVRARLMDDPERVGDAAYNLAVCELSLGHLDAARARLDEALHALTRAGAGTLDVRVVRGRLELLAEAPEAALEEVEPVLADGAEAPREIRLEALCVAGLAKARLGQLDAAEVYLAQAEALAERTPSPELPNLERLRGQLALARGDARAAARAFDREAEARRALSQYRLMIQALELAGRAWLQAGEAQVAGDRWFRAARSRASSGDSHAALELCLAALEALGEEGGEELVSRVRALVAEIRRELEVARPPQDGGV